MARGDDSNHVQTIAVDHDRSVASALDTALRDYLKQFGHERYVARLNHALEAHERAEALRNGR